MIPCCEAVPIEDGQEDVDSLKEIFEMSIGYALPQPQMLILGVGWHHVITKACQVVHFEVYGA